MKLSAISMLAVLFLTFASVSAHETTVTMLGDSTTLSAANSPGKKLTEQVQLKLTEIFKGVATTIKVVNSGVGGSTAKEAVPRVQSSVLAHKPDVVSISFGLNDTGKSTPEEFRQALETMIDEIQKGSKAQIVLITSTPFDNARHVWKDKYSKPGLDETMDTKFCQEMRTLATKRKVFLCDLHQKFKEAFAKDAKLVNKVIMPDGVHLTDEGNVLAAGLIATEISGILKGGAAK